MARTPFLIVNEQTIYLDQATRYLQSSGKLREFIGDILREYVIEQEIQTRDDLDVDPSVVQQTEIDFRLQNQLTDRQQFDNWLAQQGIDYKSFHSQIVFGFKLKNLKAQITEPKLNEYFIERQIFLDRVVISRLVVDTQDKAEELRSQIEEGASFEQFAKKYSLAEDRIVNGMMGPLSRGTMPDLVRAAIDIAKPGQIIGPIELEGRWGLFRVEEFLPASLENNQLKQSLQDELFERWLAEKIQGMSVKLQVN